MSTAASPPTNTATSSTVSSTPLPAAGGGDAVEAEGAESWRKSKIYTRTGDTGNTSLYNMQRKCKAEDFFQALGTVDEVNSQLGSAPVAHSATALRTDWQRG